MTSKYDKKIEIRTCSKLTKHKIIRTEQLPIGTRSYRIHGAWFQVNKNCSGNIFPSWGVNKFKYKTGSAHLLG